jgi:hypothetical protein
MGPDPRRTTRGDVWPELPYADWKSTCDTLHLWTQIVGKVRLACTPWINHWWLGELGVTVQIHEVPNEIVDPIPFPEDEVHASYDPEFARRFWRVLASSARVPSAAWSRELGEFLLPYDAVRKAGDPDDALRSFLTSTYDVAADLAKWDRSELEWGQGGRPRLERP